MPFRKLKNVCSHGAFFTPTLPITELSDGSVVSSLLDVHSDLPDVEDFYIENQLAAGLPLKQVDTRLFKPTLLDVSDMLDSAKVVEPSFESNLQGDEK